MTTTATVPAYVVDAFEAALDNLKRKAAELREALARAERGPGYEGQPPAAAAADSQGRMRRAPAIELMWKKGQMSDGQFLAAQRYWMDVEMSVIAPTQVARYEAPAAIDPSHISGRSKVEKMEAALSMTTARGAKRQPGRSVPLSDLKLDAIARVNRVHERILKGADREWKGAGEGERRACLMVVEMVAVRDHSIMQVAAARTWGNRNTVGRRLKLALDVMARHYGTADAGSGGGIRSAHAEDYRPEIDAPMAALAQAG